MKKSHLVNVSVDVKGWFHGVDHLPEKFWTSYPSSRASLVPNTCSVLDLVKFKVLARPRGGPWVTRISQGGSEDHTYLKDTI